MPHTPSAYKRLRQNAKRHLRNKSLKSVLKGALTAAEAAAKAGDAEKLKAAVNAAVRELDRSAHKGILHKNTAARRKSRLMRLANAKKA